MSADSYSAAIHEASHAALSIATGGKVDKVSIGNEEAAAPHGYVRARYSRSRRGELANMLSCLGGYAGEWWYSTGGDEEAVRASLKYGIAMQTDAVDFTRYAKIAAGFEGSQIGPIRYSREKINVDAIDQTIALVRNNWPAIVEIAWHLKQAGSLSGVAVEFLYEEATRSPAADVYSDLLGA